MHTSPEKMTKITQNQENKNENISTFTLRRYYSTIIKRGHSAVPPLADTTQVSERFKIL